MYSTVWFTILVFYPAVLYLFLKSYENCDDVVKELKTVFHGGGGILVMSPGSSLVVGMLGITIE